jgi:uncharacterized protein YbjT (DUF2867 family)
MYVITGASGNIGKRVAEALLAAGKPVRAIARHAGKLADLKAKGAEIATGDLHDVAFLTKAYSDATALLTLIPGDFSVTDIRAYQDAIADAHIAALKASSAKYVVNISSNGAHVTENNGPIAGLARFEQKLNMLSGLNVLHLRPTYFMENQFANLGMIKTMGVVGSSAPPDVKIPMIATQDIAKVAVEKLLALNFTSHTVLPLLGATDVSFAEAATIIGNAIGKPDLKYIQFPADQAKQGMMQAGLTEAWADTYNDMNQGIGLGVMNYEQRTAETTTPTTLEEFAKTTFAYVYNLQ